LALAHDEPTTLSLFPLPSVFGDHEAEVACLGALTLDQSAIAVLREALVADDFRSERHRAIFKAASDLAEAGAVVDFVTLRKQLERNGALPQAGGVEYLAELSASVFTAASVEHWARIVRETGVRRRVALVLVEAQKHVHDEGRGVEEVAGEVAGRLAVETTPRGGSRVTLGDGLRAAYGQLEASQQARAEGRMFVSGTPTGFADIDRMTGGMERQQLWLIGARPGMGKTIWALNVARRIAGTGVPVLFASLEMSTVELSQRLIACDARVDWKAITQRGGSVEEMERIATAMERLQRLPLRIEDRVDRRVSAVRAAARRMQLGGGLGLIVVDYLGKLQATTREGRTEQVSELAAGCKNMAKDLDVPVLALQQLSREVDRRAGGRPVLADLRDSGQLEAEADVVGFLYRPVVYDEKAAPTAAEFIIAKQRQGPLGTVPLIFAGEQFAFRNAYTATQNGHNATTRWHEESA
jgi:replicative DNA helicase